MFNSQRKGLVFVKAVACGNDFLVVEDATVAADIHDLSRRLCDRHRGIGADGVEWIARDSHGDAEVAARLINADGSEAEISGNGTRCVAAYWLEKYGGDEIRIRTGAGIKTCRKVGVIEDGIVFSTAMGQPVLSGEQRVQAGSKRISGFKVSLGNPHFVVFADKFEFDWRTDGQQVQSSGDFPQGINVEFVKIQDLHSVETRFFERGVGETMSSGTGSCAAAIAAIQSGKCKSPLEVRSPGGPQTVRWEPGAEVILEGPAKLVFSGEFFG